MPDAIKYIATAVANYAATSGSALLTATAYWVTTAALTYASTAAIQAAIGTEAPSIEAVQTPFKQPRPAKRVSTGTMRVAGKALCWDSVPDWSFDVWAINEGRISEFKRFYIHDDKVTVHPTTGLVSEQPVSRKYWGEHVYIFGRTGGTPEIPTAKLVGLAGSKWTNAHRADGVAAIDVMFRSAGDKYNSRVYQDSEIVVTAVCDMSPVFDWRDPTQSLTNPMTWKFSDNAVLTHAWWEFYGRYMKNGREDNLALNPTQLRKWNRLFAPALEYWTIAANIADENIAKKSGGTRKKYRSAVTYEFGSDPAETRRKYLAAYDGKMFRLKNGAWAVRAGKYVEPTLTFTDTDILEVVEWSRGRSAADFTNVLTSTFMSPENDYTEQPVDPWEDLASIEQVGEVGKPFPLPSVPDHGQARYLLKREMSRRRASHTGVIKFKKSSGEKIGDGAHRWIRVQMTHGPLSLEDAVLEVSGAPVVDHTSQFCTVPVIVSDGFVDLWDAVLEEGFGPNETIRTPPAAIATPVIHSVVPEVQGVSGALLAVRIPSPNNHLYEYAVSWRKVGSADWNDGDFRDYADATIGGVNYAVVRSGMVQAGADYEVRVRARKSMFLSDYSSTVTADFDSVPAPGLGSYSLSAATVQQNGMAGAYMALTGVCDYALADGILVAYRPAGAGEFISLGTFPADTTAIPIGPVIEGGYYEAAVAYRSKWGAIGSALVVFSPSSSLQPIVFGEVSDGQVLDFVPPLAGIPTFNVDMSDCLAPGVGEVQLYRVTDLTTAGATIALKLSDESEETEHHTVFDSGNATGHYEALKPTVADAYNGLYKFTINVERVQPAAYAPFFSFAPIFARAAGSTEWIKIGQVGGTENGPTNATNQSSGVDTHIVTIPCSIALGSDGATQFRAWNTGNVGRAISCKVEYDTEVTSAAETPATDATHKAVVTFYPPGYNGVVTEGIFFDNAAVAAVPVIAEANIPSAEILGRFAGQKVAIPVASLPFSSGGGGSGSSLREVNIGSYGTNEAALNTAAAAAYDASGVANRVLVGNAGLMTITGYKNWENRNIDLPPCLIRFGTNIGAATGGNALPTYTYHLGDPAPDYQTEVTVLGPVIDIGGNPGANQHLSKRIRVHGNSGSQSQDVVALRIRGDQRALADYDVGISSHRGDGLELRDDTEKKRILLHADHVINGYPLTVRSTQGSAPNYSPNASPDEIYVDHIQTANNYIYYGQDGVQASITHNCLIESITPALGRYAIVIGTRKSEKWIGEIRGVDGRLMLVETRGRGYTGGGCHLALDLNVIQHYNGDIYIANPKSLTGKLVVNFSRTNRDSGTTGLTDMATVTIGSVLGYCNFTYECRRNTSPSGLDLGDETYAGPWTLGSDGVTNTRTIGLSLDGATINVAIEMGSFEGSDQAPANDFYALRCRAGVGTTVNCAYLAGNIEIRSAWQECTINVLADWARSGATVVRVGEPTTDLNIYGSIDLAELAGLTWAFKGCKAMSVTDFDGAAACFDGAYWVPLAQIKLPAVSMAALGSPYNAEDFVKQLGAAVVSRANGLPYFAAGPEPTDPWMTPGGTSIVPGLLTVTTNFESRAVTAGSGAFSPAYRLAFDRFLHDLIAAGVYDPSDATASLMKGFWPMMGPSLGAAKTNLLFDIWPLDVLGSLEHEAGVGLVPDLGDLVGACSEVLNWQTSPYGTDVHDMSILSGSGALLTSEQSQIVNGGPFFSAGGNGETFRTVFHRSDGGNHAQMNSTEETRVIAPSLGAAGGNYRIGIAWTPSATSQSIRMFRGQTVTAAKVASASTTRVFFGHAHTYYLRTSLEFGGLGSGQITSEQAGVILAATNTLRTSLLALA